MNRPPLRRGALALLRAHVLLGLLVLGLACQQNEPTIQSHLEGRITVSSQIDTSSDYSDFRVLVVRPRGRTIDTLGHATTDRTGRFEMTVEAPKRDVYKLTVWGRQGNERLVTSNYVVAEGDSGSLELELPHEQGPVQIKSPENVALLGYENTMAMHRRMLSQRLQAGEYRTESLVQSIRLTSSVLWSLRENYPDTYASDVAAVEALSLLDGWNDSLVVERIHEIEPSNDRFVEAVRIARQAQARLNGQEAALALLDTLEARSTDSPKRAGVQAVRVQTYLDSAQTDEALSAAQRLRSEFPDTQWASWAARAEYEAENLMPGMEAPTISMRTLAGDSLSLDDLRGRPVVLEFYRPGNETYNQQLSARNSLYRSTRADSVAFISISTDPDTLVNRAFLSNYHLLGKKVIAPLGPDDPIVERYNVVDLPTRYLLNSQGQIVRQYPGSALLALRLDLTRMTAESPRAL